MAAFVIGPLLAGLLVAAAVLLETGMSDVEIARRRQLSARTIEDHKRKILEIFGTTMEARHRGFAQLTRELGIRPGDLVNDQAGRRPARGLIARAMPWTRSGNASRRPMHGGGPGRGQ